MPRSRRNNVLRDTPNMVASKVERAKTKKCPKCGRGAALRTDPTIVYCYWTLQGKCDYFRERE